MKSPILGSPALPPPPPPPLPDPSSGGSLALGAVGSAGATGLSVRPVAAGLSLGVAFGAAGTIGPAGPLGASPVAGALSAGAPAGALSAGAVGLVPSAWAGLPLPAGSSAGAPAQPARPSMRAGAKRSDALPTSDARRALRFWIVCGCLDTRPLRDCVRETPGLADVPRCGVDEPAARNADTSECGARF